MICVGEMLHDDVGCCRTKPQFAFVVSKGDSNRIYTQLMQVLKMATSKRCSRDERGAKVIVLLLLHAIDYCRLIFSVFTA